jgi:hypothetical protein
LGSPPKRRFLATDDAFFATIFTGGKRGPARCVSFPGSFEDLSVTITRVGTNMKYAMGWESAFTGKKAKATAEKKKASPKKKGASKKKAKK